jgi:hypothetical protein
MKKEREFCLGSGRRGDLAGVIAAIANFVHVPVRIQKPVLARRQNQHARRVRSPNPEIA